MQSQYNQAQIWQKQIKNKQKVLCKFIRLMAVVPARKWTQMFASCAEFSEKLFKEVVFYFLKEINEKNVFDSNLILQCKLVYGQPMILCNTDL